MLNADRAVRMNSCPRCGAGGFETLRSHSYCLECNHSVIPETDEFLAIPKWVLDVLKAPKMKKEKQQNEYCHDERLLAMA